MSDDQSDASQTSFLLVVIKPQRLDTFETLPIDLPVLCTSFNADLSPTASAFPSKLQTILKMEVKLELVLTRTVTVNFVDSDLKDLSHLVQQVQRSDQETIHSMKIVEVDGRRVGTSLDASSALEVNGDQKIAKSRQLVSALLQKLRIGLWVSFIRIEKCQAWND